MEKKQRFNIRDVAGRANVSVATVSRVLNGYKWINEEVRQRVMDVIREMEFVPDFTAMAGGNTRIIVVIVPIVINPFFTQFIDDFIKTVKKQKYCVVVYATDDGREEIEFLQDSLCSMADGIIDITSVQDIHLLKSVEKPMIIVDRNFAENDFIDCIINDNKTAVYNVVTYLAQKGHHDIALLVGRSGVGIVSDKKEGYLEALAACGIAFRKELCMQGSWRMEEGSLYAEELLLLERPPTAIVAGNNFLCKGVMETVRRMGLALGEDISLIGFEECDTDTRFFQKEDITVIRIDTTRMALRAAELLIQKMEKKGGGSKWVQEVFRMDFVERGSVKEILPK